MDNLATYGLLITINNYFYVLYTIYEFNPMGVPGGKLIYD